MISLYDKVMIKETQLEGIVVDIYETTEKIYTVESNEKGMREDGYGGKFPLFDCKRNEIEKIS